MKNYWVRWRVRILGLAKFSPAKTSVKNVYLLAFIVWHEINACGRCLLWLFPTSMRDMYPELIWLNISCIRAVPKVKKVLGILAQLKFKRLSGELGGYLAGQIRRREWARRPAARRRSTAACCRTWDGSPRPWRWKEQPWFSDRNNEEKLIRAPRKKS